MNKFEIKMDNGDIHVVESNFTIEEISNEIGKLNAERGIITMKSKILRLKHIISIELIK